MLFIVNSLPKSGATWFCSYINRLLILGGGVSTKIALEPHVRVNPWGAAGELSGSNLDKILAAATQHTFVVKAHQPPADDLLAALADGRARMLFMIRHPADILRSALAYGEYCRDFYVDEPHKNIFTPEDAINFCEPHMQWGFKWFGVDGVEICRYEYTFSCDAHIIQTALRLIPNQTDGAEAALNDRRVSSLSQRERNHLRVNLIRKPLLNSAAEAWANAWAPRYWY